MTEKRARTTQDAPPQSTAERPPMPSDMPAYSAQIMFEMSNTLGRVEERLGTVLKTVDDLDSRLKSIESHTVFVKGAVAAAVVLVPFCIGMLWWSLGDKIDSALRQLNFVQEEKAK